MRDITTSVQYTGWPDDEPWQMTREEYLEYRAYGDVLADLERLSPSEAAEFAKHSPWVRATVIAARAHDLLIQEARADGRIPTLAGQSDAGYETRLAADRVTAEWRVKSSKRLDGGKAPITDGPLWGGPAQGGLW